MAKDIQTRAREVLESDTARAVAATAVGEAIRRVGSTRNQASKGINQAAKSISDIRVPAAAGFARMALSMRKTLLETVGSFKEGVPKCDCFRPRA